MGSLHGQPTKAVVVQTTPKTQRWEEVITWSYKFSESVFFLSQELQIKRKPREFLYPQTGFVSSWKMLLCSFQGFCMTTPAPSPAAAILSQLLGKAGPCIQSSKGHSSNTALAPRKATGTPRCRFSTENTFRGSVHAFPEGSTATVSSAGSAISVWGWGAGCEAACTAPVTLTAAKGQSYSQPAKGDNPAAPRAQTEPGKWRKKWGVWSSEEY